MAKTPKPKWTPRPEDFRTAILDQNPWSNNGEVPSALAPPVERRLGRDLNQVLRRASPKRFQLILGPRRVGKSTAMYHTVKHLLAAGIDRRRVWWLRLDHPLLMSLHLSALVRWIVNTSGATADAPAFVFLDELTYSSDWSLWLKAFYDEAWPVQIAATSSAVAALRNARVESGVGRWEEQHLSPYLFTEFLGLVGVENPVVPGRTLHETIRGAIARGHDIGSLAAHRRRYVFTGGFPELLIAFKDASADEPTRLLESQRMLRSDAIEKAVYKDIPQTFPIESPMVLERLLYTLAGQFTGILSPKNICQELDGLSQPTLDRYLSYLEQAFIVFTLPNYSGSEAAIQKRGRKLYFTDGAVRNAALQRGIAPLNDPREMGLLVENLAASHLHALGLNSQVRLYFWREKHYEIDLIYNHPEHPLAFEVSSTARHDRSGIYAFLEAFPKFKGRTYLVAPDTVPVLPDKEWDGVGTLPLDTFLLAIGAQIDAEVGHRLAQHRA